MAKRPADIGALIIWTSLKRRRKCCIRSRRSTLFVLYDALKALWEISGPSSVGAFFVVWKNAHARSASCKPRWYPRQTVTSPLAEVRTHRGPGCSRCSMRIWVSFCDLYFRVSASLRWQGSWRSESIGAIRASTACFKMSPSMLAGSIEASAYGRQTSA